MEGLLDVLVSFSNDDFILGLGIMDHLGYSRDTRIATTHIRAHFYYRASFDSKVGSRGKLREYMKEFLYGKQPNPGRVGYDSYDD